MRKWLLIPTLSVLAACSSQPSVHTYQLPQTSSINVSAPAVNTPRLHVDPVKMAPITSGMSLVYQLSETEIVQTSNNLWAQDIGFQIRSHLVQDLRSKQKQYWPQKATPLNLANSKELSVRLDKFQGTYKGNVMVAGEWTLKSLNGDLANKTQPFNIEVPLEDEGYQAQVIALSKALDQLSTQIAQNLN